MLQVAIIDDDQSVRNAIGRLLKTFSMTVAAYDSAIAFINAVASYKPDCLLLDLQLPGMNGLERVHYLNKQKLSVPTIIITGHEEVGARETYLSAGASAYLAKPLPEDILIRAILTLAPL